MFSRDPKRRAGQRFARFMHTISRKAAPRMRTPGLIVTALAVLLALSGCDGDETPVIPDREAFDAAVESYLSGRSMEMAIDEYREFTLAENGNTARAVIALAHAGEGYANLRVRWEFTFQKVNDRWRVSSHRQVK